MNPSQMEMRRTMPADLQNEAFFTQTVMECRSQLYAIAYSYLRSDSDALEALQETAFRAWSKRGSLKNPELFKTWLIRILINVCIDERRRSKRLAPLREERLPEPVEGMNYDRLEMLEVLDRLKLKHRHVLLLKYYHDLTYAEIASILNRSESTVKSWQRQGLKQLRKELKNGGAWENEES